MRAKRVSQRGLDFSKSHLKITNEYYARYEAVSTVLDQAPKLLDLIHKDLKKTLGYVNREYRGRRPEYTTDNVLRILICQVLEGASLREIVVRIDDSNFLRHFARIDNGPMMDFTTLCKLKNAIHTDTWKAVNRCLAQYAVQHELMYRPRFLGHKSVCTTRPRLERAHGAPERGCGIPFSRSAILGCSFRQTPGLRFSPLRRCGRSGRRSFAP